MSGFGAFDLARISPGRFCGVGGHSPALWLSGADTAPGAFDDAEDFARHDVVDAARAGRPFGRTPVWIDAGASDPFLSADREFAASCTCPCTSHPADTTAATGTVTRRTTFASTRPRCRAVRAGPFASLRT